ncbi:hypothetical protein BGZ60DRAFT_149669 [Tricladium varicosporioides]|nr:hypothetical protein BGZ60DRAFT_149669 [Hymenoscyphus varicosporioides]
MITCAWGRALALVTSPASTSPSLSSTDHTLAFFSITLHSPSYSRSLSNTPSFSFIPRCEIKTYQVPTLAQPLKLDKDRREV